MIINGLLLSNQISGSILLKKTYRLIANISVVIAEFSRIVCGKVLLYIAIDNMYWMEIGLWKQ